MNLIFYPRTVLDTNKFRNIAQENEIECKWDARGAFFAIPTLEEEVDDLEEELAELIIGKVAGKFESDF